jgi:hypothetical protein
VSTVVGGSPLLTAAVTAARSSALRRGYAALRARADTPRLLQAVLLATWLAALVLVLVANAGLAEARRTIQTIGKDAAPSIVAAQSMKASMADLDANAANDLLGGPNGLAVARDAYEKDRLNVVAGLVAAARNITYPEEPPLIQSMANNVSLYAADVAQARVYNQLGDQASATAALRSATDLMHQQIIPAAESLDAVNLGYLDRAYAARQQAGLASQLLVIAAGLLLLGPLVWLQVFLYRRTRRLLNLPLLGATLVALFLVLRLVVVLGAVAADLKWAKQDAFDSVHALWQARAIAYDANGDESFYLLPGFDRQRYDASFKQKAAQLVDRPLDEQAVRAAAAGQVQFKGRLADELNNITFNGELSAASDTLRAWVQYVSLDGRLRALEQAGQHAEAVALDVGTQPGQSNWAFDQFDQALGRTLEINQREFDAAVQSAFDDLNGADLLGPIAALIVAVLVWAGLRPRLAEYRG